MTHRELEGLLAGARPDMLIQRGETLEAVAETVEWLGEQIRARANELEWQGQTADEFREWIRHFHHTSVDLKTYASFMASAITNAGVALRQAQSEMPPAPPQEMPATALDVAYDTGDGERPMTMTEAESSRQEAIAVINRLGSVYKTSAGTIQYVNEREPLFQQFGTDPGVLPFPELHSPAPNPPGAFPPAAAATHPPIQQEMPAWNSSAIAPSSHQPPQQPSGVTPQPDFGDDGTRTSLDSVGVVPNGGVPPVAPSGSPPPVVVERPVGGGPPQQPVVGPVPGWPSPAQPGQGRGGGGQVPPVRGPGLRPGEAPVVRPFGPPSGPGSQPPVGRPAGPGMPGGQHPPVGRPPTGGGGPDGGNPWGRANNYGLLGGKPVPNAKPTVASRIPPGGVIQPGMNAANSRLTPTRNDQPNTTPRPTYGKATVDGRPATGRGERGRSLPKPTGVIGLPGQGRKNGKKKQKKNESKDDRQQP
ncbi:WXG100 family type VII secretion target [Streptomyces xiamenensis]|uniref:WXG100 family type VII secretion target n=1 Tax=Streptomyces xiamenensis TaxID=408015 RepID=UPI0035D91DDF